jgi:hypothetical protein
MSQADKARAPVEPLSYADPALRRQQWFEVLGRTFHVRQIVFATGMALVLGALGYAAGDYTHTNSETPVCTAIGGLLMGLAVPIPRHARH